MKEKSILNKEIKFPSKNVKNSKRVIAVTYILVILAGLVVLFATTFFGFEIVPYVVMVICVLCMNYWMYLIDDEVEMKSRFIWILAMNEFVIKMIPLWCVVLCLLFVSGQAFVVIMCFLGMIFFSNIMIALYYVCKKISDNVRVRLVLGMCFSISMLLYFASLFTYSPEEVYLRHDAFGVFGQMIELPNINILLWVLKCLVIIIGLYVIGDWGQWCFIQMKNWFDGLSKRRTGGQEKN